MTRSPWAEILRRAAHQRIPTEAGFPGSRRRTDVSLRLRLPDSGRDRWYPVSCLSGYAGPAGDLTREGTDASDSAAPCGWNGPTIHAPEPPLLLIRAGEGPIPLRAADRCRRRTGFSPCCHVGWGLSSAPGLGSNDNVCATIQKVKHPAREKFFIPSRTRGYAIFGRSARTEFRHDSCNTAPRGERI